MTAAASTPEPIIVVAEYYGSGGTRTYVKQLLDFYRECRQPVILIACHEQPDSEIATLLEQCGGSFRNYWNVVGSAFRDPRPDDQPSAWSPLSQYRERRAMKRFMVESGARGLVVTAGTPGQFAGASGASARSIYILHTYPHGSRQRVLGRLFMSRLFRKTRTFVAVSEFQKSEMVRLWRLRPQASTVRVIRNTAGEVLPPRLRPPDQPFEVITASWVEDYKGPRAWLATARNVVNHFGPHAVCFRWMGDGSLLVDMQRAVQDASLGASVSFAGHVDDVSSAYGSASVYLQLSTTENMSLSTIDALRFGVPSVVSDVGGLPEIVDQGGAGVVVSMGDSEAAARAVENLLLDGNLWLRMSAASQARYRDQFSPEHWTSCMVRLHQEVFSGRWDANPRGDQLETS